jgi:acyl-coenzyme A synthetase/AMP-(fatty) acid ligase
MKKIGRFWESRTAGSLRKNGRDFCKGEISGFKVPKRIFFYEGPLPRTPTGKVQKFILVKKYSQ